MIDLFTSDWRTLWGAEASSEPVGAIYTRPDIVELILDLAGFVPERRRLSTVRVLEPSCGDGVFLVAVLRRILDSEALHCQAIDWNDSAFTDALRASDISGQAIDGARREVVALLRERGCPAKRARTLAETWIRQTDFLLEPWGERFGLVVGNPPYVRIEDLPRPVLAAYRSEFETLTDRADLYVAFIQRGLELLADDGVLAYICANRFAKNQYGAALRQLIVSKYGVKVYLNLEHTQPFLSDVSAYPAIVVVGRDRKTRTLSATLSDLESSTLKRVAAEGLGKARAGKLMHRFKEWYPGGAPWIATDRKEFDNLNTLAESLPVLEDSGDGTRVGIGVATGADNVFITDKLVDEIEHSRQIPMAMARDVQSTAIKWSGHFLVNPFSDDDDGSLVDLARFPGLAKHLELHGQQLRGRHVGKREQSWFRTIDRIWPKLTATPKLLIPDIQAGCVVGLDSGEWYPHHNLYFVVSREWPLPALQAILRSTAVLRQVQANSVQMRGGSVRYQAQVLRKLRVPAFRSLATQTVERLCQVGASASQSDVDAVADAAFAEALTSRC